MTITQPCAPQKHAHASSALSASTFSPPRAGFHTLPTTLKACTTCGRTIRIGTRCAAHQRPVYNHQHRAQAAALLPHAINTSCPICLELMTKGQRLDLDHTLNAITHAKCNRSNTHAVTARRGVGA